MRIAGVDVGKVVEVERGRDGEQAARRDDADRGRGRGPIHKDATLKIRPRMFLEGNWFLDLSPARRRRPSSRTGQTIPIQPDRRRRCSSARCSPRSRRTPARTSRACSRATARLEGEGASGFNRSIPYWEPAYRDSAIVQDATLGERRARPVGLHRRRRRASPRRSTAARRSCKSLITDFNTTAGAFAREAGSLERPSPSCRARCAPRSPRSASCNAAFPPLRRLPPTCGPASADRGDDRRRSCPFLRQPRGLVSEAELRGLAADLRPTAPALAALNERDVPLLEQVRARVELRERGAPCVVDGQGPGPHFPADGPGLRGGAQAAARPGGREPHGDANGQWVHVADRRRPHVRSANAFAPATEPILGTNPPKPAKRPPLRPTCRARRRSRPTCARSPAAPPPQRRGRHRAAAARGALRAGARQGGRVAAAASCEAEGLDELLKVAGEPTSASRA